MSRTGPIMDRRLTCSVQTSDIKYYEPSWFGPVHTLVPSVQHARISFERHRDTDIKCSTAACADTVDLEWPSLANEDR